MGLSTLEVKIQNLSWLHIKESERYKGVNDRDVTEEAHGRGSKILHEILVLFPKLEPVERIPQVKTVDERTGDFLGRQTIDFYRSPDTSLIVVKYSNIPNPKYDKVITDMDMFISDPDRVRCRKCKHEIEGILESYKAKDSIDRSHSFQCIIR